MEKQKDIIRNQWKFLAGFGLISILITGLMTAFRFTELEFQLHDTYFVINSFPTIIYLTVLLVTIRNLYLLIDILTNRYPIIAIFIAIINPLVGLFMVIMIYLNVQGLRTYTETYPNMDYIGRLIPILIAMGLLGLQAITEIKILRKLRGFINDKW